MPDRLPDWDAAAGALEGTLAAAWPDAGRAELLALDPRPLLRALEEAARRLTGAAAAPAAAREMPEALAAAATLAAQATLWATWGSRLDAPDTAAARADLLGAAPATLVAAVAGGTTALGGLVARFEAHRSAWRGEAPAYVGRLAATAAEVATALAALALADRWPR